MFTAALLHLLRCTFGIGLALVLCAFIGFCTKAHAAEPLVVGLHLVTAHHGNHALKTETPGVYVRHASGATGGVFRNSYDRWSVYAGWSWQTPGQAFAITAGAVTGYPAARVMPLLVPSARIPIAGMALRIAYIPKPMKGGTASGIHLSVEKEF